MTDPYVPPKADGEQPEVLPPSPAQLGVISLSYGILGIIVSAPMAFFVAISYVCAVEPPGLSSSGGFWLTASAASFVVPPLVYHLTGTRWATKAGRASIGMGSVLVTVVLTYLLVTLSDVLVAGGTLRFVPQLLIGTVAGLLVSPVGLIPGLLIKPRPSA